MAEYITITGQKHYYGVLPFTIGASLSLCPDEENLYDRDAVSVVSPAFGKVGYVAQSAETRAEGTISAAECKSRGYKGATIRFIAGDYILAELSL